jgi:hypothetical protein
MLHDQSERVAPKGAQGSKTRQRAVHIYTMHSHTIPHCALHPFFDSLPLAPCDRPLTRVVTCANRADGEEKKIVDVEQGSSWEDKIVREIGCH